MKQFSKLKNKNVLVLGLGISGKSAIDLLDKLGANVYYHDDSNSKYNIGSPVDYHLAKDFIEQDISLIIKSPGIPLENWYVNNALILKIPVITEIELGYLVCDSHLIAITGTNGKTTVTSLIYEMLKKGISNKIFKAGNIGIPFSQVVQEADRDSFIVCEVSSFQLEFTEQFHPEIAVLNNIFPHHLEHHHLFKNYLEAKCKIFKNQTDKDYLVVNYDQKDFLPYLTQARSQIISFGSADNNKYVWADDINIYYKKQIICSRSDLTLVGEHNLENFIAASIVAKLLKVSNEDIKFVAKKFKGVQHRLEYLGMKNGVKFYNDSKATDEEATIVALESINSPIILLAGGMDRGDKFLKIAKYLKNVKLVELFGENKKVLGKVFEGSNISTNYFSNIQEAFNDALKNSNSGDTILLSPLSASWDQFKSFEERGDIFKDLYRRSLS